MKPKPSLDMAEAVSKLGATDQTAAEAPVLPEIKSSATLIANKHGDAKESKTTLRGEKSMTDQAISHEHASAKISNEVESEKLTVEEIFESRLIDLIEDYRDWMASCPSAERDSDKPTIDPIDSLIQKLNRIKDRGKVQIQQHDDLDTKDHEDESPTGAGVLIRDVGAKSNTEERAVNSVIAVLNDRFDDGDDETADNPVKTDDVARMVESVRPEDLAEAVSDGAIATASVALGGSAAEGRVLNPSAECFLPSHNNSEMSPEKTEKRRRKRNRKKHKKKKKKQQQQENAEVVQEEKEGAAEDIQPESSAVVEVVDDDKIKNQENEPADDGDSNDADAAMTDEDAVTTIQDDPGYDDDDDGAASGASAAASGATSGGGGGAPRNPNFVAFVRTPATDGSSEHLERLAKDVEREREEGDPDELCVVCEKRFTSHCNKCKVARYCSRTCQLADWPIHKKLCADFLGPAAEEKRPSPDQRRILFFPTFSSNPTLLWALHHETEDKKHEWLEYKHPDLDEFYSIPGTSTDQPRAYTVLNLLYSLKNRRIGHKLVAVAHNVIGPNGEMVQPPPINKSINHLTKPGYLRPAFGPVAFFADRRLPDENVPPKARDISPRDVHTIVRLMERHQGICLTNPERYSGETIPGLRINDPNSQVSISLNITSVFDMTTVPLCPAYVPDYAIALAFHLGLRWYIRPGNFIGMESGTTLWCDGNLRYLAFVCTISERVQESTAPATGALEGSESWEEEEAEKEMTTTTTKTVETVFNYGPFSSSVIILHGSGRPVEEAHVRAFNAYLDEVYVRRAEAPSRAGFVRFWADLKRRAGGALSSVPSPYELEEKKKGASLPDRLGQYDPAFVRDQVASRIRDVWAHVRHTLDGFNSHTFDSFDFAKQQQQQQQQRHTMS